MTERTKIATWIMVLATLSAALAAFVAALWRGT
jgi:hypothetical protein